MKKNKMMRFASALLVLTLLSTCAISGTFAKYTTQDSGSDVARVAKWGVALQVEGDLYSQNYLTGTNTATDDTTGISVESYQQLPTTGDNLVAPGTENNEGFKFTVEGKPEVSSKVTANIEAQNIFLTNGYYGVMTEYGTVSAETYADVMADGEETNKFYVVDENGVYKLATAWSETTTYYTLEDYVEVGADYYPVIYTLAGNGVTYDAGTTGADSLSEIAKLIAQAVNGNTAAVAKNAESKYVYSAIQSEDYVPNTDLTLESALNLDDCVLTWEWAFEGQNDEADTILGNLMAGTELQGTVVKQSPTGFVAPTEHTDYCLDTSFALDITVTQVD